ncbi:hypothetical protein CBR_g12545 [Chara braunii]|uniref:Reverse transcriptase domain-containing protein n=1 Tax=Chara braunii TaxID=69332 RepID=A0A388JSS4_CHABU|nr:hypothetical protein CBR_g12545 [Chara braunii]|eukprot:GBG60807.1 hypothetical protein CBR_g12545 [Chara braunii]
MYVVVSVFFSADRRELEAVERTLIRMWSPSLNSKGVKRRSRRRRRPGRKERREAVASKVKGSGEEKTERKVEGNNTIVALRRDGGERTVRVIELLRSLAKVPRGVKTRMWSDGGRSWADNWRVVRRTFGESRVIVGKRTRPLRKCKKLFGVEGWIMVRDVVEATPRTLKLKQELVSIFKDRRKMRLLYSKTQEELVNYYAAAKLFSEKRSRSRGRRVISDVLRRSFGLSIRRRIVVKVEFDERIKKSKVVNLTRQGIGRLPLNNAIAGMVRRRNHVVWTRSPNVGDIIHNHRRFAADGVSECICTSMPLPKEGGHVHFRIGNWDGCPTIARNAKNVPRNVKDGLVARLSKKLADNFADLSWLGKGMGQMEFAQEEIEICVSKSRTDNCDDADAVQRVREGLNGLVCCPLDRNPGDTLVMCPVTYAEGMKTTSTANDGYVIREESEDEIINLLHTEYGKRKFGQIGEWKKDGKLGRAYILPKHKDTAKYRPIYPTFSEPSGRACKKVARALNGMLFSVPESKHFNLKSVSELCDRLIGINQRMRRAYKDVQVLSDSYDIKDMFSRLPHATIVSVVDWFIWWFGSKGLQGVFVSKRGKGTMFSKGKSVDGFQFINFGMIREFVLFELGGCFTVARRVILQQVVGIPMGKSTSPPLACMMCAKAKWDFFVTLGNDRRLVAKLRYVDDPSVFVAFDSRRPESRRKAEEIIESFEVCYNKALP